MVEHTEDVLDVGCVFLETMETIRNDAQGQPELGVPCARGKIEGSVGSNHGAGNHLLANRLLEFRFEMAA